MGDVLHPSDYFCGPSLDCLQQVHVLLLGWVGRVKMGMLPPKQSRFPQQWAVLPPQIMSPPLLAAGAVQRAETICLNAQT